MLDIRIFRENPDRIREALRTRGEEVDAVEGILSLDERRRQQLQAVEKHRADQRTLSKEIGKLQGDKQKTPEMEIRIQQMIGSMKTLSDEVGHEEQELRVVEDNLNARLMEIPNMPDSSVPLGKSSADNVLAHSDGEPRKFSFVPKPHWELGEKLGIIDFARGVKISGTRFYVLRGLGAKLERALIAFMLDLHIAEHGFTEMYMPFMVKKECLYGSGNLPKFGDNLYHDAEEDFYWVPTAEVPLTNLHRDEILEHGKLPLKYVAYTPCFRREKMAAGKETRGLKRGHQFDKVEMYVYSEPQHSFEELEIMVKAAGDVLRRLELPFHVLRLCTGDLGFASAKTYDLEAWAPGLNEWLEVSSCSNCVDFQARRTNIRYRPASGAKPIFPHTLNGSGLALPRVVIAVLENYQREDGTVAIPKALQAYMGTDTITP